MKSGENQCEKGVASSRMLAPVLSASIDVISWGEALSRISVWSLNNESRVVCICNVHSVVTASQETEFGRVVNEADMATPDGAPVAWVVRALGYKCQQRINGPDLMWRYCENAQLHDEAIFLFGSTEETLDKLKIRLLAVFPKLNIAGAISPPFRILTPEEDATIVEQINASGAGTVWVSLGCPKQELWMAAHRGRIKGVMIGVGAAFDYHAGIIKRAPLWMQKSGLEWFYRLCSEPRRLSKRYFVTNSIFLWMIIRMLLSEKFKRIIH